MCMTGGELLRNWRRMKTITQVEAGLILGIHPQQISRYENGRTIPGHYIAIHLFNNCAIPLKSWTSRKGRTL